MTCSEIHKCYTCGDDPTITCVYDLWYVKCIRCEKIVVNPRKQTAIDNWNFENPLSKKLGTKTKDRELMRRKKKHKGGRVYHCNPVYRLSINGNKVEKFDSITEFSKAIGVPFNKISDSFKRSHTGRIVVKGNTYVREHSTQTAPKTTSRSGSKKV